MDGNGKELANVPATQQTGMQLRDSPYDLAPRNLQEALDLAERLSTSSMIPKGYQGKPGDIFVAIQFGNEVGLKPLQALQGIASINGKPGLYGDAGKALLLSKGCMIEEADFAEIAQTGVARCTITRPDSRAATRTFSMAQAKQAGLASKDGPWKQYPERQLMWRAFWFAARDIASDLLKGLGGLEELLDMRDVTAEGETLERNSGGPQSKGEAAAKAAAANKSATPPAQPAQQQRSNVPRAEAPKAKSQGRTYDNGFSDPDPATATAARAPAAAAEQGDGVGVPASEGMVKHIRARIATATLSEIEACKRFKIDTIDGIDVATANAILKWTADPTS